MTTVSEYADLIMTMIRQDVSAGLVSEDVTSFEQLHSYLDANEYTIQAGLFPDDETEDPFRLINEVEAEVGRPAWRRVVAAMSNEKCAVFLRVSTTDQTTSNQVPEVERLVAHRGLTEVARYVVSDSASHPGEEYRAALAQMLLDAHMGKWRTLVVWAADRLTREGIEPLLRIVRKLSESGCTLISAQEPWLNGSDANTELMLAIAAWMAKQESARRSERVRAGMARAKAQGKTVGGRKPGAKDRKPRKRQGYLQEQARRRAEAVPGT